MEFLGYIIGQNRISIAPEKVEVVLSWETPKSLTDTQSFLRFTNFYRQFIHDYFQVACPLMELTKGEGRNWTWNRKAQAAFWELMKQFTAAPIVLPHFNAQ